jgi:hypothetical protein
LATSLMVTYLRTGRSLPMPLTVSLRKRRNPLSP